MIVQALVDYARYIRSDSRFIITWHSKIKVTWKNWDLGQGLINIRVELGDVLLVQGRDNVVFILVVTTSSRRRDEHTVTDFFAQIIGADYGR